MTQQTPLLKLEGISLTFGGLQVIQDLDIAVARGEICSLIGPNGAGKSSLLNIINGIYQPHRGKITLDGQHLKSHRPQLAAKLGISRTFQNLALFKKMSVLDNVLTGRTLKISATWPEYLLGLPRAKREANAQRQSAEEIIAFLHLEPWRHSIVSTLSYGLQKRVELARALAAEPSLLLLDEPMAGMNSDEKQDMARLIRDVNRELGTTVVIIEHDIGIVMALSDHIIVLDYGRKIGDGTADEIRQNPDVLAAYLGQSPIEKQQLETRH
ncbi:ABC transporter ATP-binding protein [Aquirhabdus sp.]|uniref:ABC transporter ATP-binding protein n=1 Tax=Aquirhabdus sp. TaxID=2824160 RepID=UPI00396CA850